MADGEYNNRTVYGMDSDSSRYIWAGYFLFIIVSTLIGDTFILLASIHYRAFKLHKVIVSIIQHIALCDLTVSLTNAFPKLVSIITSEWIFGNFLCYISSYSGLYFGLVSIVLISALTTSKVFLLKYPLRSGTITLKNTHVFCTVCWMAALTYPATFLLVDGQDIYFSYRSYQCTYSYSSDIWRWLGPSLAFIFGAIPTCLVVISTIFLLMTARKVARRSRENLKREGVVTAVITAAVYCISVLPIVFYAAGKNTIIVDDKSESFLHTSYYRLATSFLFLNTISNFYIYSLTLPSFRKFVQSRFRVFYLYIMSFAIRSVRSRGKKLRNRIKYLRS